MDKPANRIEYLVDKLTGVLVLIDEAKSLEEQAIQADAVMHEAMAKRDEKRQEVRSALKEWRSEFEALLGDRGFVDTVNAAAKQLEEAKANPLYR